jgi:hypothetical protein
MSAFHRHFIAWFIALFAFAFFEWRHHGFVSYVFPFPILVLLPGIILLGGLLVKVVKASGSEY